MSTLPWSDDDTTQVVHGYTPATADAVDWLDDTYPEQDVAILHTGDCDRVSRGDECVGGCPVVNA